MSEKQFVHLHLHTDYSLLDGAIQIKKLAARAAELKMPAVAMTDHGNMFGAISFYTEMKKAGVKPIIGAEVYVARGHHKDRGEPDRPKGMNHLILLATNLEGYQNLVKLTSFGFTEGYYYKPRIDREMLQEHREGLIGLSACLSGVPSSLLIHEKQDEAEQQALLFNEILGQGNYFLEVQKQTGIDVQDRVNKGMFEISRRTGIPLAVTNDSHFLMREDYDAHKALLSIGTGKPLSQGSMHYSPDHYFRSMQEMWMLFGRDLPEALENTVRIADRCNVEIPMSGHHLPVFRVPDGHTVDTYFAEVSRRGLEERWELHVRDFPGRKHSLEEYKDRLDHELRVITQMGFPGYFLIVWDFIRFAKEHQIPVGPGRGSAAGSLAAYCLKITDVDPLQYDLLFERFLNPERVSMPDIDIDFCVRGRGEVIKYVSDYYGRDHVSQIITFGTMASKAAIKDVGRALEMPFGEVDRIAKMIPPPIRGRNVSIEDATEMNPDLKKEIERNAQVKQLIDLAKRLEGCSRHASVHAAGVVISPKPIHELVPVYKSAKDEITTQYAMSDLEKTGMLKMDFLALTTLTIIEDCLKTIEAETGAALDLSKIPLEDPGALKVFADGRTDAIFQFEGCLSGETQIGGQHHTIRELYEQVRGMKERGEFAVEGRNGVLRLKSCYVDDGRFHSNAVLDVVASGVKPVYRIVAEGNYTIKATADHRFLTQRGWVRLGELDPTSDKLLFKTDTHYAKRICADCTAPLKSRVAKVVRCKACAARITSNPSKPQARAKISRANTGKRPWNYGIDHESDRFGQWTTSIVRGYEKYKGKPIEASLGAERAARLRERASLRFKGRGNPMYGRSHHGPSVYSAAGFRTDIGHYVRSSWEADFARVLNFLGFEYEYEPKRFSLVRTDGTTMTYAPDFFVPAEGCWYEIKGWMDRTSAEKIRLFREQYPDERLFVVDKTQFAELQMKYQGIVRWECPKMPRNTSLLTIQSITAEGEEETFDITMQAPGNNFLANGFVVHNSGMKEICRKLGPEGIDDLAALNALYRPGPIDSGMVDDFIDRRHGRKKVTFDFAALKDILGPTLGIVVFQEQVMALFQRLAGYSLGEADVVRRIMGKKKRDELDKHREKFISAAEKNGHDRKKLDKLWQMLEGFADYAFNKCLAGDATIVDADTGATVTIEQIANREVTTSRTFSFDGATVFVDEIVEAFETGDQEVVEMELEDGRTIRCTLDHKFYTAEGMLPLREIIERDLEIHVSTDVDRYAENCAEQKAHA